MAPGRVVTLLASSLSVAARQWRCGLGDRLAQLAVPADKPSRRARAREAVREVGNLRRNERLHAVNLTRGEEFEIAVIK